MLEKSFKSRDKLTLSTANYHSLDLNRSITNSVMTSSYIVLKDGTKKKKRNINSYMEEFLEKRRMAAEFAQAKRSTSTKNYRVKLTGDEKNNKDNEFNIQFNIKKIEETININNLKNNLPGKTTELINNNNNIGNNLSKYLNPSNPQNNEGDNINKNICVQKQNNFNVIQNKYNNFKRHNIVYTKKTNLSQNLGKNINLSNHSFTEDRYNTNHDNEEQCNIINTIITNDNENKIEDISPIKQNHIILNAKGGIEFTDNKDNENEEKKILEDKKEENKDNYKINDGEHFLTIMDKMIKNVNLNMNKSQSSPDISKGDSKHFNQVSTSQNNNFNKYKEYQKFLNKNDNNNDNVNDELHINDLNQNIMINKDNNTDDENKLDINNKIDINEKITNQEILSLKQEILDLNKEEKNSLKNINEKNDKINNINKEPNSNQKITEEYVVEENEEKNINKINYEKEEENEIENENEEIEQEKSINRQNEENEEQEDEEVNNINSNNNEEEEEENEDAERCEVLKGDEDKSKYLKRKNNIITEEIEEVEEGMDNENTSEFPTNKTGRNKNSNRNMNGLIQEEKNSSENKNVIINNKDINISSENKKNENSEEKNEQVLLDKINKEKEEINKNIEIKNEPKEKDESLKIIRDEKKYNNLNKIEIKDLKHNKATNLKNITNKNYSFVYSNTSKLNQIINEKNNITNNTLENNNTFESNENNNNNNLVNISNSNNNEKESDINNEEFNLNKISDINNINSEINDIIESPNKTNFFNYERNTKEKEDFMRVINKDIERLERIRNNNNNTKEDESYIYEIDNFINLMREKRKSVNNDIITNTDMSYLNKKDYIPPKNILELKKIYKNLNTKNNNINTETNYNNILQKINYNKMKLPISKSSSLQSLLNEIKKEKTYNININNININNENQIINNNFFTEKINKEINDSINNINNINNNSEEAKNSEDNVKINFKLFDETKFRKIKESNLRKRNKFRNEFKFKDYNTNKNLSHIYLDKVKEDLLMNINMIKPINKRGEKNKWNIKKITFSNNNYIMTDLDNSEIMPANSMKSLYFNKF